MNQARNVNVGDEEKNYMFVGVILMLELVLVGGAGVAYWLFVKE